MYADWPNLSSGVEQQTVARLGDTASKSLRLSEKREDLPEGLENVGELYAYGIKYV